MTRRLTSPILILPAVLLGTSCAGTDVGNPTLSLDAALVQESAAPGGSVSQAWINVERIRLRPAGNCDGEAEIDLEGPFALDLLAPGIPPALTDLAVSSTRYCRFELRWAPLDDANPGAPGELAGASLLVMGERADGTPFVLRSSRNDELRLDAVNGAFQIDASRTSLFVGLNAAELFAGVTLEDAEVAAGGEIRIEADSNEDLLLSFEEALETTTRLFRDSDGDDVLDDDEGDPSRALAD